MTGFIVGGELEFREKSPIYEQLWKSNYTLHLLGRQDEDISFWPDRSARDGEIDIWRIVSL